jgi:hypothetical protein
MYLLGPAHVECVALHTGGSARLSDDLPSRVREQGAKERQTKERNK